MATLNVADLFHWRIAVHQHSPRADSSIRLFLAGVLKLRHEPPRLDIIAVCVCVWLPPKWSVGVHKSVPPVVLPLRLPYKRHSTCAVVTTDVRLSVRFQNPAAIFSHTALSFRRHQSPSSAAGEFR